MPGTKETEAEAIRAMAKAAERSSVRLAQWQEDARTRKGRVRVWVCGWNAEDDPHDTHHIGWR